MKNTSFLLLLTFVGMSACQSNSSTGASDTTQTSPQAAPTPSQDGPTHADSSNITGPVSVSRGDQVFMAAAADAGMTEVKASQAAQQRASGDRVKQFAAMMITDHTQAGDKLKAIAQAKNVALPPDVSDAHQKAIDELKQKSGTAFDKAYMKMMVKDHEGAVHDFEQAASQVQDSSLKQFVINTLPTLKMHLDSAKAVEKGL